MLKGTADSRVATLSKITDEAMRHLNADRLAPLGFDGKKAQSAAAPPGRYIEKTGAGLCRASPFIAADFHRATVAEMGHNVNPFDRRTPLAASPSKRG